MTIPPIPGYDPSLRWLYIDFNSFFASVEQELRPELRDLPVAVVAVETDATCAIAASYEAKAFGVRTGTPIHEAKERCPDLVCVLARHEHYVAYHHRILAEVDRHLPVTQVCSIDEVACRLMDNEASLACATALAHSIKAGLRANVGAYVRCSIGVAANRYLAKVATDLHKPDGLTPLPANALPQALYGLALRDLPGIGANMERRLRTRGIGSVEALFALDRGALGRIWGGVSGERFYYLLRGVELPEEATSRRSVGHSHVLAPELRPLPSARDVGRRLTLKAASRLRRIAYHAGALHLSVRLEHGPRLEAEARCPHAQDSFTFLNLYDALWQQLASHAERLGYARLKKVSVTLHRLRAEGAPEPDLFASLPHASAVTRARAERMSHALDRLNQRFGRDTVTIGMLPAQGKSISGSKIAFTRIPDAEEFRE